MRSSILITGSEGLVGTALRQSLSLRGDLPVNLDLRSPSVRDRGDVRHAHDVQTAIAGCRGVVHLAAVSRVIWGERDPELCTATNVGGTRNVLDAARASLARPWVIFASSREVYGAPIQLPATEDCPLNPVNIYGRTKVEGERLIEEARAAGLRTATVRLSNVYGSVSDHATRVVPAFARAAVCGEPLQIEGPSHTFDFTHIDDTVRGLVSLIDLLDSDGTPPPPIHFLTGQPTSLAALAETCIQLAGSGSVRCEAPSRSFDVSHFYGDFGRARDLLGWSPQVALAEGVARLIRDFRSELQPTAVSSSR